MKTKIFGVIRDDGTGNEWLDINLSAASRDFTSYKIDQNKRIPGNCLNSMPILRIAEMEVNEL